MDRQGTTFEIASWIERLGQGDAAARHRLLEVAMGRLNLLACKIFHADFPRLGRWEDTDDITQGASLRLWNALENARPDDAVGFFRLAAALIRRELIDLSRHHFGPEGPAVHHTSQGGLSRVPGPSQGVADDPARLAAWAEFHQQVDSLPDELRTIFDLIWYQGLTQQEAADILGVTVRTVQRRWLHARRELDTRLGGVFPS